MSDEKVDKVNRVGSDGRDNRVTAMPELTDPDGVSGGQDLTAFVQSLLQQMHTRFQEMSDSIITRLDEMGERLDDLERSIGDLMNQSGLDQDVQMKTGTDGAKVLEEEFNAAENAEE